MRWASGRVRAALAAVSLLIALLLAGTLARRGGADASRHAVGSAVIGYGQIEYAGKGPEWWWNQYRQQRRAARRFKHRLETRARELAESRRALRRRIAAYGGSPLERDFLCIHTHEGDWNDAEAPYYGGVQMDLGFQRSYGSEFLRAFGTADHWPVSVQLAVAMKAYLAGRGFGPWPNTARMCGLR